MNNAATCCHPDEVSNANGRKDLGQLRASEAGTGFEIAQRSFRGVAAPRLLVLPLGRALLDECARPLGPTRAAEGHPERLLLIAIRTVNAS
jgi:hypothetical protein